jgi:rare lipoprotein A
MSAIELRARALALVWIGSVLGCSALDPGPMHGTASPSETSTGGEARAENDGSGDVEDGGAAPAAAVDERPALETTRGPVSYYADSLAGRSTASGEPYQPALLTAASRTLPFGTLVRVIREDTGESVIVRVNDRGPFGNRGRILDLSRAAAEAIGMIRAGVVTVRAEVIEWGPRRR